jgi:hypothetical protein
MSPRTGRPRVFRESRNLIVRVEREIHALLTKLAEEGDVTVSQLVRPLLERLAGGKRKRVAKRKRK